MSITFMGGQVMTGKIGIYYLEHVNEKNRK
jgi:hypothetical protein